VLLFDILTQVFSTPAQVFSVPLVAAVGDATSVASVPESGTVAERALAEAAAAASDVSCDAGRTLQQFLGTC